MYLAPRERDTSGAVAGAAGTIRAHRILKVKGSVGIPEHGMVEQVEGLKAELDSGLLAEVLAGMEGQLPVLEEGEISILNCRAGALADSTVIISTQFEALPGEGGGIRLAGDSGHRFRQRSDGN